MIMHWLDWRWLVLAITLMLVIGFSAASTLGKRRTINYWRELGEAEWSAGNLAGCVKAYERLVTLSPQNFEAAFRLAMAFDDSIGLPPIASPRQLHQAEQRLHRVLHFPNGSATQTMRSDLTQRLLWRQLQLGGLHCMKAFNRLLDAGTGLPDHRRVELLLVARCLFETMPSSRQGKWAEDIPGGKELSELLTKPIFAAIQDHVNLSLVEDRSLASFLNFFAFQRSTAAAVDIPDPLEQAIIAECMRRGNPITTLAAVRSTVAQRSSVEDLTWILEATSDALHQAFCDLNSNAVSPHASAQERIEMNSRLELAQLSLPLISKSHPELVFNWLKPWEQIFSSSRTDYPVDLELQYVNCLASSARQEDLRRFGTDALKRHSHHLQLHELMFKLAVESRFEEAYLTSILDAWGEALSCQASNLSVASVEGQTGLNNKQRRAEFQRSRWLWQLMTLYYRSAEKQLGWDQIRQLRQLILTSSEDQGVLASRLEVELLRSMGCIGEAAAAQERVCKLDPSDESFVVAADLWLEKNAFQPALRNLLLLESPTCVQQLRKARCLWEMQYRQAFPATDRATTSDLLQTLLASADCTDAEDRLVLRWMLASIPDNQTAWGDHVRSAAYQSEIREILAGFQKLGLKPSHAEWIRTPVDATCFLEHLGKADVNRTAGVAEHLLQVHCFLIQGNFDAATLTLERTVKHLADSPDWLDFFGEMLLESISSGVKDSRFELLYRVGEASNDWEFLYRVARNSGDSTVSETVAKLIAKHASCRTDLTLMLQALTDYRREIHKTVTIDGTFGETCERDLRRVLQLRPNWSEVHFALGRVLLARSIREPRIDSRASVARQAQECFQEALYLGSREHTLPYYSGLATSLAGNGDNLDLETGVIAFSRVTEESQARAKAYLTLAADGRCDLGCLEDLFKNSEGKARADGLHLASKLAWQLETRQAPDQSNLPFEQVFDWVDEAIAITRKDGASRPLESLLQLKLAWASKVSDSEVIQKFRQQLESAPLNPELKLNWTAALMSGQERDLYLLSQLGEADILGLSVENAINVALANKANVSDADHLRILKAIVAKWPDSEQARLVLGVELFEKHRTGDADAVETAELRWLLYESEFAKSQHKLLYIDWLIRSRELARCREARKICRELLITDQLTDNRLVKRRLLATFLFELGRDDVKASQKIMLSKEADVLFQQLLEASYSLELTSEYIGYLIQFGGSRGLQNAKRLVKESQSSLLGCAASLDWYLEIVEMEGGSPPLRDAAMNWYLSVPTQLSVTGLRALEKKIGLKATLEFCLDQIAASREGVGSYGVFLNDLNKEFSVETLLTGLEGSARAECLYSLIKRRKISESEAEIVSKELQRFYQQHTLGRDAWHLYADYLNERGERTEAQQIYLTLMKRFPKNLTFINNFASLAAETGAQRSLAEVKLRSAISRHPGHPVLLGTLEYLSEASRTFSGNLESGK